MYGIAYSRDQLLSLRWAQPPSASSSCVRLINIPITTRVRKRGCRGGRRRRLPAPTYTVIEGTGCSVISGNRPAHSSVTHRLQTPISSTRAVIVLSNVPPQRYVHQTAEQIHELRSSPLSKVVPPSTLCDINSLNSRRGGRRHQHLHHHEKRRQPAALPNPIPVLTTTRRLCRFSAPPPLPPPP